MGAGASQITSLTNVCATVHSGVDHRKHESPASLAFVRRIHRWPVNFPQKWPLTRKMLPFDDVIIDVVFTKLYSIGSWSYPVQISVLGDAIFWCLVIRDEDAKVSPFNTLYWEWIHVFPKICPITFRVGYLGHPSNQKSTCTQSREEPRIRYTYRLHINNRGPYIWIYCSGDIDHFTWYLSYWRHIAFGSLGIYIITIRRPCVPSILMWISKLVHKLIIYDVLLSASLTENSAHTSNLVINAFLR